MKRIPLLFVAGILFLSACNPNANLGKKIEVEKSEVYYKDGATKQDAQALGDYLLESGWFNEETKKSAQVSKDEDNYVVRLIVDKDKLKDNEEALKTIWLMQLTISQHAFEKAPTKIILADTQLKDIQEMDPVAEYKAGEDAFIDYNSKEFKKADAKKLSAVLEQAGFWNYKGDKRVLLTKEDEKNVVRLVVSKKTLGKNADAFMPMYAKLLYDIKENAFDGNKTAMFLTAKENYEDFKKIPLPSKDEIEQMQNNQPTEDRTDNSENTENTRNVPSTDTQ